MAKVNSISERFRRDNAHGFHERAICAPAYKARLALARDSGRWVAELEETPSLGSETARGREWPRPGK
jgi:hypothetical protein